MPRLKSYTKPVGINVVPTNNPDVVPRVVVRDIEAVSPLCELACPLEAKGQCRISDGAGGVFCDVPFTAWSVAWANPAVSLKHYDPIEARPEDYIEWVWDDVLHDVWQLQSKAAFDKCDFTGAKLLHKAVHHSYELPSGTDIDGRALFQIPADSKGQTLYFACGVPSHCPLGQKMSVNVGQEAAPRTDTKLAKGVCAPEYVLCPDQSLQGAVTEKVRTKTNIPWTNSRAAESLQLEGKVTRAQIPWTKWQAKQIDGKTCRWRDNSKKSQPGSIPWADMGGNPVWEYTEATLREVVEPCSGNYPEHCVGIAWKKSASGGRGMHTGAHHFRRCLVTHGYTRVLKIGKSPVDLVKTVSCPGCYQCREVPYRPATIANNLNWATLGFRFEYGKDQQGVTTVTIWLPTPTWSHDRDDGGWKHRHTWYHDMEVICRVDKTQAPAAQADLEEDAGWVTFLRPDEGTDEDHMAAGFDIPRAVAMQTSTDLALLKAAYAPGDQLDSSVTKGPWAVHDPKDMTTPVLPPRKQVPEATDGGVNWPPAPFVKVSFIPRGTCHTRRTGTPSCRTAEDVDKVLSATKEAGWIVDRGDLLDTHKVGGKEWKYGWRCPAQLWWYGTKTDVTFSPFAFGHLRNPSSFSDTKTLLKLGHCPDGKPNRFDIHVPNGQYLVHVGHDQSHAQPAFSGCVYENVRPAIKDRRKAGPVRSLEDPLSHSYQNTNVFSVEVEDGTFTLTSWIAPCSNVNWFKLNRISSKPLPSVWLPAPEHEWWQIELKESTRVGLVRITLPHSKGVTSWSYPALSEKTPAADCRTWWLYGSAKCRRYTMLGQRGGTHPELASYPNNPGYTKAFLEMLFDHHDTDKNGEMTLAEWKAASKDSPYGWNFYAWGNWGLHYAQTLFQRFDRKVGDDDAVHNDGKVSREEFTQGVLAQPRDDWCDPFEATRGAMCSRYSNMWHLIPQEFGSFDADGHHGAVVAVSDTACGASGCDTSKETLCEIHTDVQYGDLGYDYDVNVPYPVPVQIDCKGAKGRYVRIRLPGKGERLMPHAEVAVHRDKLPTNTSVPSASDAKMPMTCYGLQAREVPAANDPNVLAETKKHPMQIVTDNPEDPIYYSSCLVREVERVWMPVLSDEGDGAAQHAWFWKDRGQCLACESYTQNYVTALKTPFDSKALNTTHWWLQQSCGACEVCGGAASAAFSTLSVADKLEAMGRKQCPATTQEPGNCNHALDV